MIHDVDETLRAIVRRDVINGSNVDVAFETPNSDWASRRQGPALNMYLYDIREDLERRRPQQYEVAGEEGHTVERRTPPRYFKLSYLVTAWTQRPEDEHRLLSGVLTSFLSFEALPRELVAGALGSLGLPVKCTIGLPPPQDRSIADVWSAFGGELKPSLDLVVHAPFPALVPRGEVAGPLVTEEPRLTVVAGEGATETPKGRRRKGMAAETPNQEIEEVLRGGKTGTRGDDGPVQGRTFTVRTIPRKPRP